MENLKTGGLTACCVESANASTWVIDVSETANLGTKQKMGLMGAALLIVSLSNYFLLKLRLLKIKKKITELCF